MADSIRVSLPTSGDEAEMGAAPDDPLPTPGPGGGAGGGGEDVHQAQQPLRQHSSQHSGSSSHGHGHGGHRPQKRRRIPVACGACRSKKSRVSEKSKAAENMLPQRRGSSSSTLMMMIFGKRDVYPDQHR